MEKKEYREHLEMLLEMFPGRMTITVKEAAEVMSSDIRTIYNATKLVKNPLPSKKLCGKIVIPIAAFANWLS